MDRRSDVFGLGAMLCEILTGQPPYVGDLDDVKRQAQEADLADAFARLETCGADVDLIKLAKSCLAKERDDRLQDAGEVAKAVEEYMAAVEARAEEDRQKAAAAAARAEEAKATTREAQAKEAAQRARAAEAEARAAAERRARRRTLWLAASVVLLLLATGVASLFKWQASKAEVARLKARQDQLAAELAREAEKRQHAIDRALTAAMGADLEGADQAIAEAEQAGASPGQLHMRRGQIALHRGQSRDAIRHLEEAVRLLPNSVAAWGMLAAAYADDGHWERYDQAIRKMDPLTPSTPEDYLFKGYAQAYLEPKLGLETIKQAFDRRPMMSIALLLRAEVRAMLAQDTDKLDEAEGAVQDAKYAKELLHNNPTALWVSLEAHLAKAGVHEHLKEPKQRQAELELAGKDADALKRFTALPEAVVYRWTYFREVDREEEVLDELRRSSKDTDHVSVKFCCALALYRRGKPGDFEEALRMLENRPGTYNYNDRLLPFVLAEHDYQNKHDWPAKARKAIEDFAETSQDGAAVNDTQTVLCLLGRKEDAVKASKALLKRPELFYTLRREPILRCVRYNAGELTEDKLLEDAGSSRWDQCLAHYNIAMTKLAEGDRKGAKEHFDKAVKTRAAGWGEYDLSWVFLSRLEKDHTWPKWIP
jgi:tetratricopeptide (TPR) repeat protein